MREIWREFRGIFSDPQNIIKAQKIGENFGAFFVRKSLDGGNSALVIGF